LQYQEPTPRRPPDEAAASFLAEKTRKNRKRSSVVPNIGNDSSNPWNPFLKIRLTRFPLPPENQLFVRHFSFHRLFIHATCLSHGKSRLRK
jgi:hypothetical protein